MKLCVKLFVLFECLVFCASRLNSQIDECPSHPKLNALPGNGWCSLRNIELNPAFSVTYEKCQVLETPTKKYLIPDYLHLTPKSTSDIGTTQEIIGNYQNFTSVTAMSMSASASGSYGKFSAAGSFSLDYQSMKKSQVINKSVTSRITGRYVLHAATFDEYAVELHPDLKAKFLDAIEAISVGHLSKASLILEMAILSHGTHAITSIDLGGVIVKEDYLSEMYMSGDDMDQVGWTASASIGFADFFNAKSSFSKSDYQNQYNNYVRNITTTKIRSHGGELFKSETLNISNWVDSLPNYLVAVDRSGVALPYLITPRHFPNANQTVLAALRREYVEAIEHFNAVNIRKGCMNQYSNNFDYNANIGDKSCQDPPTNYTLGGFFQSCTCDNGRSRCSQCNDYVVKNFLTADTSCPTMFTPVFLNGKSLRNCWQNCYKIFFFFTHCDTVCDAFEYKAYWCAANQHPIPKDTGLMFGGVYTSTAKNPVTDSKSCPPNFFSVAILQDLTVCTSVDYEFGYKYSVPFGGLSSCHQGNPLAAISKSNQNTAKLNLQGAKPTCGDGYSQHTAAIDNDCLILYCVKANSFGHGEKEIPIVLPPFQNYDDMFAEEVMMIPIPVAKESSVVIIVLGCLLGFVISAVVGYVGWKKIRAKRSNSAGNEQSSLIGNDRATGYQRIEE